MQSDNRIADDLARLVSGALGAAGGLRQEIEGRLRQPLERALSRMDLVSREEFEVMKAVAEAARSAQEDLESRVAALEARLEALEAAAGSAASGEGPTADSTT